MRKLTITVMALIGLCVFDRPLEACGDKLLSMARNIRLHAAYTPWRPATILLYQVRADNPLRDKQFQASLKQAGHTIRTVDTESQLDRALAAGRYDLIVSDIADADALSRKLASLRTPPPLLPVLFRPSRDQIASAEQRYRVVITAPSAFTQHLEAIDRMMKTTAQGF